MRRVMDCRTMPSESNCSLVIIGEEEEVVRAAVMHAVDVHGHEQTPDLESGIRGSLTEGAASCRLTDGSPARIVSPYAS
jgi:predicted small metal-binding protein